MDKNKKIPADMHAFMRELIQEVLEEDRLMNELVDMDIEMFAKWGHISDAMFKAEIAGKLDSFYKNLQDKLSGPSQEAADYFHSFIKANRDSLPEGTFVTESLRKWLNQEWVRITSSGKIGGACGTSEKQSNPDRCLPKAKAKSMTQSQRAATAKKKKEGGSKGKQFVSNTNKGKVTSEQLSIAVKEVLAEKAKKKKPGKATATHRADGKPKDACHKKVDGRYGQKGSAYKSLAIGACRKVGAANWGKGKKKKSNESTDHKAMNPGILSKDSSLKGEDGKIKISKVRSALAGMKDKGSTKAKALRRFINYHD